MRTRSAPLIRLKDYSPPAYRISHVDMTVQLDPTDTIINTRLTVHRPDYTQAGTPLVLDGDELALEAISIDGTALAAADFDATPQRLTLQNPPHADRFAVEITTRVAPVSNTKLMGLYQSNGVFCTQCEAEGFRRLTYFLDRPDVLAVYDVRLEADREACPVLLSNGNPGRSGDLPNGRHFAEWHDPHPKPCYLFALVGGRLDRLDDRFETMSGRHVDLAIYVEEGKAPQAEYAMDALKRSMRWDEDAYGCEYDLDVFNIVAVSDFNMGAMENKGLNIFNDKYILARPDLATDNDYANIEAIVAHEYFHNWTGNRITCRDWFQLCLKEGLTVYRDQEFSADQRSRAVQRILQVRGLKAAQFPEDAGPLAHPVRPGSYKEINNFYTATVYQKGAELVRMIHTMIGPEAFRRGTDLYFKRHDGEAAVVEDFIACFEEASGTDLSQFMRWYSQAGTPVVTVKEDWNPNSGTYALTLEQATPPTPKQKRKASVPIPIRFGLMGQDGSDQPIQTRSQLVRDDVILLNRKRAKISFTGLEERPLPSLLRGFSAPVRLAMEEPDDALMHRALHDSDLFNRWQALDQLSLKHLAKAASGKSVDWEPIAEAVSATAFDDNLEPLFRANCLTVPTAMAVARDIGRDVEPNRVTDTRSELLRALGEELGDRALEAAARLSSIPNADDIERYGERALKWALLALAAATGRGSALDAVAAQEKSATLMTDRVAALGILCQHDHDADRVQAALDRFYDQFRDNPLVIHTWFGVQASIPGKEGLARVRALTKHSDYSLKNPNRLRALLAPFVAHNVSAFWGGGNDALDLFFDEMTRLDEINPQVAARMLTMISSYRVFAPEIAESTRQKLSTLCEKPSLSRDVQEIVESLLG